MESWDSDLSNNMYYVNVVKALILKDHNTFCKMTPTNKGEEPAKRFESTTSMLMQCLISKWFSKDQFWGFML